LTKRTRMHDVLDYIVVFADENSGITPSSRTIASALGLSQSRIQYLMTRLLAEGYIEYVDREKYKVCHSQWEPPPHLEKHSVQLTMFS